MEDILSSIKRIIAEENDGFSAVRSRRPERARAMADEVLELREPAPEAADAPERAPRPAVEPHRPRAVSVGEPREAAPDAPTPDAAPKAVDTILSDQAIAATRDSIDALSRLVVKPDSPGSDTLEGLVREMLRPMLREWLDAKLPAIVERTVAREISRITARGD